MTYNNGRTCINEYAVIIDTTLLKYLHFHVLEKKFPQ